MTDPISIAIIDDDRAFSGYLRALLHSRGYTVDAYASGRDFLDAVDRGATPSVALLDVLMPGMDGLATLRALRARRPNLQVIMLSGSQLPSTIVDAVRLGAVDYVVKPGDPEGLGEAALEATVRSALEKARLADEVARLKAQVIEDADGAQPCWGSGAAMRHVITMIDRVADSDVPVLLSGESGVGKEVIARDIHRRSPRRGRPFVKVNCAALPADLLESELFGHERGAFTGADQARLGRFEFANGGTLLLDEIGEMPTSLQPKILHVLQDGAVARLGSNRATTVDVRVLAATNRNLSAMMANGRFREDLYYRLQVIDIPVPPLRERQDEILPLAEFFLMRYSARYGRRVERLSSSLRAALAGFAWPGNVRQLENMIKRYVILQDEALITEELQRPATPNGFVDSKPASPPPPTSPVPTAIADTPPPRNESLLVTSRRVAETAERQLIVTALTECRWNRRKAAARLGIAYKTLRNKIRDFGLNDSTPTETVPPPKP